MRIMQVLGGAEHGGAEMAFVDMSIAFRDAGQDVLVVCRPNETRVGLLRDAGVQTVTLPFGGWLDFKTKSGMKRIIKDFKPDIMQCWMARASHKSPGWTPDLPKFVKLARLGGYYNIKYFKTCDYFVTITPDIKRHLMDNGVDEDRIRHINNFAETENDFDPVSRDDLDTPEDAKVFLSLSRLHVNKAIDTLLRAAARVPDAYLWLAGEGPERESLEALCQELGLQDRVRFLGWRTDRAALFAAADYCVFPSRHEPFGTVFVQAWANKTPVITSAAQGAGQFVKHEQDGLMIAVDDVDGFAQAMQRVIDDPELCQRMVAAGHERYRNEFEKTQIVRQYLDWYEAVMKREGITLRPSSGAA